MAELKSITINGVKYDSFPGPSSNVKETDPTVYDWARRELFNKKDLPLDTQSFVTVDDVEYYRYHAGATYGFTWTNPNPQLGAVTITARGVSQYGDTGGTRLKTIYDDGTYGPELYIVVSGESRTVTVTTDESKTLAKITGNYDLENWVLLDMSVMSVMANYNSNWAPNKYLGTDAEGNVVVKDAPEGTGSNSSPNVELDTTLTVEGKAADAAATGAALKALEDKLPEESGGVSDYTELTNKPKINGVEVSGNKTSADLGIGNPTDEQVGAAVESWLGEHPEATTTVADGSITEQKLADGAVSAKKTSFISFDGTSANLFNKKTTTDGLVLDVSGTKTDATMCISDFIPVESGVKYCHYYKGGRRVHFFDSEKTFISQTLVYGNFTTPQNTAYIRISFPITEKDVFMVVKGETLPAEYIPYAEYYSINGSIKVAVENIKDLEALFHAAPDYSIPLSAMDANAQDKIGGVDNRVNTAVGWNDVRQSTKTLTGRINVFEHAVKGVFNIASDISDKTIVVHGVNYFDKNDLIPGTVNSSGNIATSTTTYFTNCLIPVKPGKRLFYNRSTADGVRSYLVICYYDADQKWVRNQAIGASMYPGFISPAEDEYFIRVQCGDLVDADAEKICIADVDIGNPVYGGYEGNAGIDTTVAKTYFGKNVYFPYVGYRIENGVLIGASDTYTVEEITHVDVYDSASTIEVTVPIEEEFDQKRLQNVTLKFGRHADTDYVIARIFKSTITGDTITPRVLAFTPGGKTMRVLAGESDFVMCINAGIFNTSDNSCYGTTIADGVVITDHVDSPTCGLSDTLCVDKNGNFLSYPYATATADMLAAGVTQAVQGWCTIIENYVATDLEVKTEELSLPDTVNDVLTSKHPRTSVGQYADGDYFVFICGGRETNQAGMTCAEMQEIFVAEGLKYAYNLDGGGSCNMWLYKKELAPYTENRADPSYIVFE